LNSKATNIEKIKNEMKELRTELKESVDFVSKKKKKYCKPPEPRPTGTADIRTRKISRPLQQTDLDTSKQNTQGHTSTG
jgi:hypothetical protein